MICFGLDETMYCLELGAVEVDLDLLGESEGCQVHRQE